MSEPKRHHILPESYLSYFCYSGKLWVYDRKENKFREQTPKNTALKKHYYSYVRADGKRVTDAEKFLAWIDGFSAPLLSKLHRRKRLTDEDCAYLAAFIACMYVRVERFEKFVESAVLEDAERIADKKFGTDWRNKSIMTVNRGFIHAVRLKLVSEFGVEFDNLNWRFHRAVKSAAFVTCDNPLTVVPPPETEDDRVGIVTPGTLKVLPLSSLVCLVMGERGRTTSYGRLTKTYVNRLNHAIAVNSTRFVIARDEAHLRSVVKTAQSREWRRHFWD